MYSAAAEAGAAGVASHRGWQANLYNAAVTGRDRVYTTEAIVLRRQDFGEADRILTIFSLTHGKRRVIAKGVRRPRSRKAGHLEPYTRVRMLLARGREMDIVTQAEAAELFPGLRGDLIRLGHAAYAVELLDRFTVEEGAHRPLYELLNQTLARLADGADPALALRSFELRLLDLAGFRPELNRCVRCGEEIRPEDQYFSPEDGGVLCARDGPKREGSSRLSLAALKVLRHLQRHPWDEAQRLRLSPATAQEVERVMEGYLTYLLERRLHAPEFLRRVRLLLQGQGLPEPVSPEAPR